MCIFSGVTITKGHENERNECLFAIQWQFGIVKCRVDRPTGNINKNYNAEIKSTFNSKRNGDNFFYSHSTMRTTRIVTAAASININKYTTKKKKK